jgi:SMC interacting uncharacterized protein involved in chromosome segregation
MDLAQKKDKAAEMREELKQMEEEIVAEEHEIKLVSLLYELREQWLALRRGINPDPLTSIPKETLDLEQRLEEVLGPTDQQKSLTEKLKEMKLDRQRRVRRRCTGGMMSYCAPAPYEYEDVTP